MNQDQLWGIQMQHLTHESLHEDVVAILRIVLFVVVVQLKHFLLGVLLGSVVVSRTLVCLKIVQPKRGATNGTPGIMSGLPGFAIQERFSATSFGSFVFHPFPKICPHEIIPSIYIEFVQEEARSPVGILTVNDTKDGLSDTVWLFQSQQGA